MTRRPAPGRIRVAEVVALVGGAVLLAVSWWIVAARDHVPAFEARAFDAVNGLPGFIWPVVWLPMQLGTFVAALSIPVVVLAVSRDRRLSAATLLAGQLAFWASKSVKRLVLRGRPNVLLTDVHLREHAGGLGYVSGHTAVAFAVCAAITPSLPRPWQWAAVVVAVVVGFARVYSGAHLPLDVVGGAGLGLLAGTFSRWSFGLGGEGLPTRKV